MAESNAFVVYDSYYKVIQKLEKQSKEEAYDLVCALMEYGLYGKKYDDSDPVISALMENLSFSIDRSKDRYAKAVEGATVGGRKTKYDKDLIIELSKNGLKNKDIAAQIGCSEKTVQRALADLKKEKINPGAISIENYVRAGEDGKPVFDF